MGALNKNSVRQKLIRLEIGATVIFPIERADYVAALAHRVAKRFGMKFTCPTTEKLIKVTRIS